MFGFRLEALAFVVTAPRYQLLRSLPRLTVTKRVSADIFHIAAGIVSFGIILLYIARFQRFTHIRVTSGTYSFFSEKIQVSLHSVLFVYGVAAFGTYQFTVAVLPVWYIFTHTPIILRIYPYLLGIAIPCPAAYLTAH